MSSNSTTDVDVERHLRADQTAAELRSSAACAAVVIMISQGCKFALLFGVNIILARLLMPKDFGLVAIVTSIIAGFSLFNDLSLPMATVQRHEINHEQVSGYRAIRADKAAVLHRARRDGTRGEWLLLSTNVYWRLAAVAGRPPDAAWPVQTNSLSPLTEESFQNSRFEASHAAQTKAL